MPRETAENAEVWRDRVKRWKQSGLTAKAFAELEGLPRASALSWWRHRLSQAEKKKPPVEDLPLRLVRVEASEVLPSSSGSPRGRSDAGAVVSPIEVVRGDYRIVVRAGCDLTMLEGVLRAVERAR
jgi:hypothetical protein